MLKIFKAKLSIHLIWSLIASLLVTSAYVFIVWDDAQAQWHLEKGFHEAWLKSDRKAACDSLFKNGDLLQQRVRSNSNLSCGAHHLNLNPEMVLPSLCEAPYESQIETLRQQLRQIACFDSRGLRTTEPDPGPMRWRIKAVMAEYQQGFITTAISLFLFLLMLLSAIKLILLEINIGWQRIGLVSAPIGAGLLLWYVGNSSTAFEQYSGAIVVVVSLLLGGGAAVLLILGTRKTILWIVRGFRQSQISQQD